MQSVQLCTICSKLLMDTLPKIVVQCQLNSRNLVEEVYNLILGSCTLIMFASQQSPVTVLWPEGGSGWVPQLRQVAACLAYIGTYCSHAYHPHIINCATMGGRCLRIYSFLGLFLLAVRKQTATANYSFVVKGEQLDRINLALVNSCCSSKTVCVYVILWACHSFLLHNLHEAIADLYNYYVGGM